MTAPIFIQPTAYGRWHRLLTVGVASHVTACRARIDATEPVYLTATEPPRELLCGACGADLEAKRRRGAAAYELTPCVLELGQVADLEPEPPAVSRTATLDLRSPRAAVDPAAAWDGPSWDPPSAAPDDATAFDHLCDLRDLEGA